eukprot:429556_1
MACKTVSCGGFVSFGSTYFLMCFKDILTSSLYRMLRTFYVLQLFEIWMILYGPTYDSDNLRSLPTLVFATKRNTLSPILYLGIFLRLRSYVSSVVHRTAVWSPRFLGTFW